MQKVLLVIFIIGMAFLSSKTIQAQNPDGDFKSQNFNLYLELYGNAKFLSLNFEKPLMISKKYPCLIRIGAGYYTNPDTLNYIFPLTFSRIFPHKYNSLEVGAGIAPRYSNKGTFNMD